MQQVSAHLSEAVGELEVVCLELLRVALEHQQLRAVVVQSVRLERRAQLEQTPLLRLERAHLLQQLVTLFGPRATGRAGGRPLAARQESLQHLHSRGSVTIFAELNALATCNKQVELGK